eukprot:730446-Pyramimonas_sp.AAC.1
MQTWQFNWNRIRSKGPSIPDAVWPDMEGFSNRDYQNLHRRSTDALRHVGVLISTSHHHDVSKQAGCPSTWAECKRSDFHIKGILL